MARVWRRTQSVHTASSLPRSRSSIQPSGSSSGGSGTAPHAEHGNIGCPPYAGQPMPPDRRPRYRTGDPELDRKIGELLDHAGAENDRDLLFELLVSVMLLAKDGTDTLDLKISSAALREMRDAYRVFAPYRDWSKVTIFGSARVKPDDPLYAQAREVASAMASKGWMVVTGAGPGIMAAGMEGAGRERSFGVSIQLPFEQGENEIIAQDEKLVAMKYFFTRKLMLVKESKAFICLPGGFGTLDETFELLTLIQTGKSLPAPIVFLDVPGGSYWQRVERFIQDELASRGLVDSADLNLVYMTDDSRAAAAEIEGFYRNYDSMRYVGDTLVIRVQSPPTPEQLELLNERFSHLCTSGAIEATGPLLVELRDGDRLELPRIRLEFAKRYFGHLRALIDLLNSFTS
jgi:uncharacterized protein (TIGR00730 family)